MVSKEKHVSPTACLTVCCPVAAKELHISQPLESWQNPRTDQERPQRDEDFSYATSPSSSTQDLVSWRNTEEDAYL